MNKIGAEELLGEENAERKTGENFQRGSASQIRDEFAAATPYQNMYLPSIKFADRRWISR
jgi:hypothetical protein